MDGHGQTFNFHGCYSDKAEAFVKANEVGGIVRPRTVNGETLYLVLKNITGGLKK